LFISAERIVFGSRPKYNVLLFINYEEERGESLGGEYLLRKDGMEESSPLFREGGYSKRERLDFLLD
jgi:hypothetical protein